MSVAAIGIICKAPQPGRSKTRLATAIGVVAASELSACFLRDVAAAIEAVPEALGRRGYGVYAPAEPNTSCASCFRQGSDCCYRPATISDTCCLARRARSCLPDMTVSCSSMATAQPCLPVCWCRRLKTLREPGDRMVLGPASDGGYYLIGLKHPHRRCSRESHGEQKPCSPTCERAAEIGLATTLLPEWYDVDDIETLRWLQDELAGHSTRFRGGGFAPASRAFLKAAPQISP